MMLLFTFFACFALGVIAGSLLTVTGLVDRFANWLLAMFEASRKAD